MGAEQGPALGTSPSSPLHYPPAPHPCGEEGVRLTAFLSGWVTEMLKDKNKPVVPARARGPRGRKKRPGEAEESADPEAQAAALETCRGLLRSILTHWGPVVGAAPESTAPGLACAATSLAVRWALRSVAECPPSRAEAAGLLGWLKSHVLPQPGVVAELLGDSAVRSSIFKLYSRFCSAGELAGPARSLACLFSEVLLQLLAAQGPARSPCHPAVQRLCLASLQEDDGATAGEVPRRACRGLGM